MRSAVFYDVMVPTCQDFVVTDKGPPLVLLVPLLPQPTKTHMGCTRTTHLCALLWMHVPACVVHVLTMSNTHRHSASPLLSLPPLACPGVLTLSLSYPASLAMLQAALRLRLAGGGTAGAARVVVAPCSAGAAGPIRPLLAAGTTSTAALASVLLVNSSCAQLTFDPPLNPAVK